MNKTQSFNEITLTFQNCENIIIDARAIRTLNFTGGQQSFFFKNNELHYRTDLVLLTLSINSNNTEYFRHPVGDIGVEKDSTKTDGEVCFERIRRSDDLTSIIINGTEYSVPWDEGNKHSNNWQRNDILDDGFGGNYLCIRVQQPTQND